MKNKRILLLYIFINLYTLSVVWAGDDHLLPLPQRYSLSHTYFRLENVTLFTSVLQKEWESFSSLTTKRYSAPVWTTTYRTRSNVTPLGNENCVVRPPIAVTLHKSWNKVFLKLPVGRFSTPEVRLVKWMFTVVTKI